MTLIQRAKSDSAKGKLFSKFKLSLVILSQFEFSRQKLDTKLLENCKFQSISNI